LDGLVWIHACSVTSARAGSAKGGRIMGLDMYLHIRKHVAGYDWYSQESKDLYRKVIELVDTNNLQNEESKSVTIEFESMYWRKANAIHGWFVENIQNGEDNCEKYSVLPEMLHELVQDCKEVLNNPGKAEELLPVKEGFFFGSYAYDDWYFNYVRYTAERLSQLLKVVENDPSVWLTYQSSW